MAVFYLALISIGAWWIVVFLTRQAIREQFIQLVRADSAAPAYQAPQPALRPQPAIPAGTPGKMQRPLNIRVIGCLLLAGCFSMIWGVVLRTAAVLFTNELTGSAAVAFYVTSIALHAYIGIGLLRLRRAARIMAIAYFLFWMLSSAVFYFAPGGHDRLVSLITKQQSVFPWMQEWQNQPSFQLDFTPLLFIGAFIGLLSALIQVYFLVTRKNAFEKAILPTNEMR